MRLLAYRKDGGPESRVWGVFFIEIKRLFSVVLLHFANSSRDAFHSHAFDAVSWVVKGALQEYVMLDESGQHVFLNRYRPSLRPVITRRETFHRVVSEGDTWVISFRGPWASTWREWLPAERRLITLTHGRKEIA